MAIRVMLIDDEAGIRMLLGKIIQKQAHFEIVGESANLTDAVTMFNKLRPDVVFLDVELGGAGGNGIECARIIADMDPKTKIIFATAHAEYMPEAFSVYAFDYLVKPFCVDRVNQTLERIRTLGGEGVRESCVSFGEDGAGCTENGVHEDKQEAPAIGRRKRSFVPEEIRRGRGLDRLLIKGRESASFVDTADIILVQREEGSTVIYTAKDAFFTSAGLSEIEARLNPRQFMRSHKSYLINVSKIKRIEPYGRWTFVATFGELDKDALITAEKYEELKRRYY